MTTQHQERERERAPAVREPSGGPPLVEELPALDPWTACCLLSSLPHLLFLDSAGDHPALGRCSFVTAAPFAFLRSRGRRVWLDGAEREGDPWRVLAEELARWPMETLPGLPPFQGGAAGLF